MSHKTLTRLVPSVLLLSSLAALHPAAAQFVTFGSPQTISGISDVSTSGTLVAAYNFGGDSSTATVNGVKFSAVTSQSGSGSLAITNADNFYKSFGNDGTPPTAYSVLDSTYKGLITNGLYRNSANPMTFVQSGLTAGERYQVQYFVNESRAFNTRTESVSSSGGNSTTLAYCNSSSNGGVGQYVTGTFTAVPGTTSGTVTITANGNVSTQINGLQIRDLGINVGAPITFGAATAIGTADAALGGLAGTIFSAAAFGAGSQDVVLTGGQTIHFDGTGANATVVGGNGTFNTAFTGDTGNATFNTVLNGANYDSPAGSKQITLSGLTAGQQYSVQLFGLDDRGAQNNRSFSFSDFSGNNSASIITGANDYILGTFTAASSFETLTENLPNNGNINALVVRNLSSISAAPEPSQVASLAFAALGMAGLILKARKRKTSVELN